MSIFGRNNSQKFILKRFVSKLSMYIAKKYNSNLTFWLFEIDYHKIKEYNSVLNVITLGAL